MTAEVSTEPFGSTATTSDSAPGRAGPSGLSPPGIEGSPVTEPWTCMSGPASLGWSWAAFEDTGLDAGGAVGTCGRVAAVIAARGRSAGVTVEADRLGMGRTGELDRGVMRVAGVAGAPAVPLAGSGAARSTQERAEEIAAPPLPEGRSVTRSTRITIIACTITEQTKDRPRRSSRRRPSPARRLKGE